MCLLYKYSSVESLSAGPFLEDFVSEQAEGESLVAEPSPSPGDTTEGKLQAANPNRHCDTKL